MKALDQIERAVDLLREDLVHAEPGSDLERSILLAHFIKFKEEPSGLDGVAWKDSVLACGLAEEIVDHFCKVIPELMATRSGIVSEVEHELLTQSAIQDISSDLSEVLNGRDTGCIDPEDLDEANCSLLWVEEKLNSLLRKAGGR